MAFTEEERQEIEKAIREKAPGLGRCALCEHGHWNLQDGFVTQVLQDGPKSLKLGGPAIPSIVVICSNCGNTYLLNVIALGLRHLLESRETV